MSEAKSTKIYKYSQIREIITIVVNIIKKFFIRKYKKFICIFYKYVKK